MFVPFDKMPGYSRLWIYQADKELSDSQVMAISGILQKFLEHWRSHGNSLISSYTIKHKRFIILAVNEQLTKASGCAVDQSVELIKTIEKEFDVRLLDRTQIAYVHQDNIKTTSLATIKDKIVAGEVSLDTIVFDNLIQVKEQLDSQWKSPAKNTWLKRYFQDMLL